MDYDPAAANPEQLQAMKDLVKEAMDAGAVGISTGLIYTPGVYADEAEITELIKVTAEYGGIYTSHIRGENDTLFEAVREAIDAAKAAEVPLHISHLKVMGRHMWGRSTELLEMIDKANTDGIDVTFDQYPYLAGATGLDASLPPWAHVGGRQKLLERLQDPETKARILADINNPDGVDGWISVQKGVGFENTLVVGYPPDPSLAGKTVAQIAEIWGLSPWDACCELLIRRGGDRVGVCYFAMGDEDMERIMVHPLMMVGSDSSGVTIKDSSVRMSGHPRGFGTFVKVLGLYAREKGLFSVEEAVRKMTSAPALRVGLKDRGLIKPGYKADLVVFDPETVNSQGDYVNPAQYPVGVYQVWVNGVLTFDGKEHTGATAGKVLKPLLH
jgi:N-acyl-D-amino-acid deacylase